jgi:hypothetical protein
MDDKTPEQIADELLAKAGVDTRGTDQNNSKGQQKRKAADVLIDLSARAEELFHAPDGTGYATACLSLLPFGTEPGTQRWLHAECWLAWHQERRADAIAARNAMGIRA